MIYLAGPYSHPTPEGREANYRAHADVAVKMLLVGLHPYSPIAHWHMVATTHDLPTDAGFWREHNRVMLAHSRELWVLPGYENSEGTKAEIEAAEQYKVPVRYLEWSDKDDGSVDI